jgi:hypothetical protein
MRWPLCSDYAFEVILVSMRQSRRYPNGQAGVECLVEMLLYPTDRRLRQKPLDLTRQSVYS